MGHTGHTEEALPKVDYRCGHWAWSYYCKAVAGEAGSAAGHGSMLAAFLKPSSLRFEGLALDQNLSRCESPRSSLGITRSRQSGDPSARCEHV